MLVEDLRLPKCKLISTQWGSTKEISEKETKELMGHVPLRGSCEEGKFPYTQKALTGSIAYGVW